MVAIHANKIARADAEEAMMYEFFNSRVHFPKVDIYKCPFLKTRGRLLKKALHSSLRA